MPVRRVVVYLDAIGVSSALEVKLFVDRCTKMSQVTSRLFYFCSSRVPESSLPGFIARFCFPMIRRSVALVFESSGQRISSTS